MRKVSTVRDVPGGIEFLALSGRIGCDSNLVQGPGGNTSIKEDGILWVKASGTLLADALTKDIFLPVRLAPLLEAAQQGDPRCETCMAFVPAEMNAQQLRPSIETTLHALLPQRVVVHVHCVETLSWACQEEAEVKLEPRLNGLDWVFVPYGRPGLPLMLAVSPKLSPVPSVVVLENHGLVIAAESVESAARLLAEVQRRLRRQPAENRLANSAKLDAIANGTTYQPADDGDVHGIALDPFRLAAASRGSLYPDHVIFLGPSAVVLGHGEALSELLTQYLCPVAPLVLVADTGALLPRDASPAAKAMARCLADVTARLRSGDRVRYLTEADEQALLNWDAEKYRQALNRARG